MSFDQALEIARKNSRDLKAARARLDESYTGIEQAWAALLPTVAAQGKYTHNYKPVKFDTSTSLIPITGGSVNGAQVPGLIDILKGGLETIGGTSGSFGTAEGQLEAYRTALRAAQPPPITIQPWDQFDGILSVNVPLIVPWAYYGLDAARKNYGASAAGFDTTETAVLVGAAQAFYAAAGTDELVRARQHAIEVAQQTLDNAKARFETGMVNRVEVARAELALVRAQQSEVESADNQGIAYRALGTILDYHEPFHVTPASSPE
jgi:outer membrane protein TolC